MPTPYWEDQGLELPHLALAEDPSLGRTQGGAPLPPFPPYSPPLQAVWGWEDPAEGLPAPSLVLAGELAPGSTFF